MGQANGALCLGRAVELGRLCEDPSVYGSNESADVKMRSYRFCVSIVRWAQGLRLNRAGNVLLSQLLRSATSVGANIVEGKSASSKRDFLRFREIALKSANETLFWLCLFRDGGLTDRASIAPLLDELKQIAAMLAAGIMTMKGKRR